jgi:hypothetical protein
MRRISLFIALLLLAASSFAGFKAKVVRPKRPAQFQARAALSGITVAADLLLSDSQQKDFFCKELNPSNIFAVRRESD